MSHSHSLRFSGSGSTTAWDTTSAANVGTSVKYDMFVNQSGIADNTDPVSAYTGVLGTGSTANKIDRLEAQKVINAALAQIQAYLGATNYAKLTRVTLRLDMTS